MATAKDKTIEKVEAPVEENLLLDWLEPTTEEARAMPLSRALANACMEYSPITRTKEGQIQTRKYMYADHSDILKAVMPALAKYEIEITHDIVYEPAGRDGRDLMLYVVVAAVKGPDERSLKWPIGILDDKSQANGANLTYARRYAISALLNLAPDDDTDGVAPGDTDNSRREDRRDRDDRRDNRRETRRDDRQDYSQEDPDAWRQQSPDQGGARKDRRREEPRREDPRGQLSKQAKDSIDMIESSGNSASCEKFWALFKTSKTCEDESPDYLAVKDVYRRRWKEHKASEQKQDPLDLVSADEKKKAGNKAAGKKETPKVDDSPDHMSPDEAIRKLEKAIENAQSVVELDTLLKEHAKLIEVASEFPPDEDAVNDMIDAIRDNLEKQAGGNRDSREDDGRGDYDDREDRPDLGDERF